MAEITDIPPERIRSELGPLQDLLSSGPAPDGEGTGSSRFPTTSRGSDRRLEVELDRSGCSAYGTRR
jgi:hypothetical protein